MCLLTQKLICMLSQFTCTHNKLSYFSVTVLIFKYKTIFFSNRDFFTAFLFFSKLTLSLIHDAYHIFKWETSIKLHFRLIFVDENEQNRILCDQFTISERHLYKLYFSDTQMSIFASLHDKLFVMCIQKLEEDTFNSIT